MYLSNHNEIRSHYTFNIQVHGGKIWDLWVSWLFYHGTPNLPECVIDDVEMSRFWWRVFIMSRICQCQNLDIDKISTCQNIVIISTLIFSRHVIISSLSRHFFYSRSLNFLLHDRFEFWSLFEHFGVVLCTVSILRSHTQHVQNRY